MDYRERDAIFRLATRLGWRTGAGYVGLYGRVDRIHQDRNLRPLAATHALGGGTEPAHVERLCAGLRDKRLGSDARRSRHGPGPFPISPEANLEALENRNIAWSTCLRTGEAAEFSQRVRNAQGGYRWILSRAEPLRASDETYCSAERVNDFETVQCRI
jgi:hypothetical protein